MRFPEFKEVWKDSNIGKCFDLYSGNTPSRMEKEHFIGDVNWITSGELKEHYIGDTKERISEKAAADNNLRILPVGTFVMAIYGLEAEGVRGTCSIIVKTSTISQACMAFTPKSNVSNEFLYSWYKKHGNKIGIRYAQGTKQQNLSYDIIEKFPIRYPSIEEQEKLNTFISLLDSRIATQNKIIEDLKKLKVAICNKLIDNLVNREPLICFSEVYSKASEGGTPETSKSEYYENGIIPFIKIDDLSNKYITSNKDFITDLGLQKSSAWIIPTHSLIYSNGATIGAISINTYEVCTKQGILGIVPKSAISVEYLYCLMSSNYFSKQVHRIITHGTMATAYLKDINKIKVPIPCMPQQLEIANTVSSVTNKIETELNILSLLKKQKQYLLQQMFI